MHYSMWNTAFCAIPLSLRQLHFNYTTAQSVDMRRQWYSTCIKDNCSPVRRLEREAIVGSLEDMGPVDGRSNLQCT